MNQNRTPIFRPERVSEKFVAVIDILGFSSTVLKDFRKSLETFDELLRSTGVVGKLIPEVEIRVYSNSFLLISDSFLRLVHTL